MLEAEQKIKEADRKMLEAEDQIKEAEFRMREVCRTKFEVERVLEAEGDILEAEQRKLEIKKFEVKQSEWKHLGKENDTVSVPPNSRVRYGIDNQWVEKIMSGTFMVCNNIFGDPAYGIGKCIQIWS